ncbi:hypothetical protein EON62_02855, partial [archaeon]
MDTNHEAAPSLMTTAAEGHTGVGPTSPRDRSCTAAHAHAAHLSPSAGAVRAVRCAAAANCFPSSPTTAASVSAAAARWPLPFPDAPSRAHDSARTPDHASDSVPTWSGTAALVLHGPMPHLSHDGSHLSKRLRVGERAGDVTTRLMHTRLRRVKFASGTKVHDGPHPLHAAFDRVVRDFLVGSVLSFTHMPLPNVPILLDGFTPITLACPVDISLPAGPVDDVRASAWHAFKQQLLQSLHAGQLRAGDGVYPMWLLPGDLRALEDLHADAPASDDVNASTSASDDAASATLSPSTGSDVAVQLDASMHLQEADAATRGMTLCSMQDGRLSSFVASATPSTSPGVCTTALPAGRVATGSVGTVDAASMGGRTGRARADSAPSSLRRYSTPRSVPLPLPEEEDDDVELQSTWSNPDGSSPFAPGDTSSNGGVASPPVCMVQHADVASTSGAASADDATMAAQMQN